MAADLILRHGWPLLLSVTVKSLFVLALAGLMVLALRRASAAARHLVWRLALLGLLLLPVLSLVPSPWRIPLWHTATEAPPTVEEPLPARQAGPPSPMRRGNERLLSLPKSSLTPPELGAGGRSPAPVSLLWPVWACGLWLAGMTLTLVPCLVGLAGVRRLAKDSQAVTEGPLPKLTASLASELAIHRSVGLFLGDMSTPITWGWRRPVILLPLDAEEWPADRLHAVLLHELAHIARGDWPAQMLSHFACALYWFQPFVWLAARQARAESERACDDRVLLAGVPAADYARHLLDVARSLRDTPLPAVLPMANAATLKGRLPFILDKACRRGEVGQRMRGLLTEAVTLPVIFSTLVAFALPSPPNLAVRLDEQSYRVIRRANVATASLRSLRARIHAVTTFTYREPSYTMDGTILLQRPNLARVEMPGPSGFTFVSDGHQSRIADHDGTTSPITLPVNGNGDNMSADDESQPFVQYFFRPDFYRLGAYLVEDVDTNIFTLAPSLHYRPIPVRAHSLGTTVWHGKPYQVVEFTRNADPSISLFKNVTTVYIGADHLVHRFVGRAYFRNGVRTDDVSLTDLQENAPLPVAAFHLPGAK